MSDVEIYQQCQLRQGPIHAPHRTLTAWIPKRGAKPNARVELLPDKEIWTVDVVFEVTMSEDQLKEDQRLARTYARRTDI